MNKLIAIPLLALFLLMIDYYVYQGISFLVQGSSAQTKKITAYVFWGITALSMLSLFAYHFVNPDFFSKKMRIALMVGIFINYFSKMFVVLFLAIDDLLRLGKWSFAKIQPLMQNAPAVPETSPVVENPISRSEFLVKTGLAVASIPIITMSFGILSGAHDYRVRRQVLKLPNLPASFDGIKIGQLSDIHSGSFFNKTAVKGGVEMLLKEKPDMVFFTGDLVNNRADELEDYFDIFKKVAAPLGVYSVLGNHDYGDYVNWGSREAKIQNLRDLMEAQRLMGWDLLMNENRLITQGGDCIAVLGIENWGAKGRFPKYGKMEKANAGTQDAPVKLLLSHDPSHWDAEVRVKYPDIDLALAGHTHGMQFGIEIPGFKWSPVQYMYHQWAGMYQEGNQRLYVNRGFGYLGYPGRIGILPEITIIELKKA